MKRRNLLRSFFLFIFAFLFGYTIKKEGENTILQRVDSEMVTGQKGTAVTEEIKILKEQVTDIVQQVDIDSLTFDIISDEIIVRNTNAIQETLNKMGKNSILKIQAGVAWDYQLIVHHPNNVEIWDTSNFDFYTKKWSGQDKKIFKTDSPETKNANGAIYISNYHPYLKVQNSEEKGRASIVLAQGHGYSPTVLLSADVYKNDKIFAIKNKKFESIFQAYVGDEKKNEIAFNRTVSSGVSYKFGSDVIGDMINQIEGNGNIVNKYVIKGAEKFRESLNNDGSYSIQQRGQTNRGFSFNSDGVITYGYYQQKIVTGLDPATTKTPFKQGDIWIRISASEGQNIGKVCVADGSPGTWVDIGQIGYRKTEGTPVGNIVPNYIGEELLDTTNFVWYKSHGITSKHWKAMT
ncbi:hypothetical protein [Peribacillus asahii]|uniref:hypothetical protein n=1 Tax=Peribacillus asahii TaxID=228899 RepID=UPI002079E056|nr:hypothetical protein [Peribacillus asahii]USK59567.1 hypothetical protein LIT37_20795 [Peribacillus asahii]